MEVWEYGSEARPKVLSTANLVVALLLHLAFFLGLFVYAKFNFHEDEVIVPIDLTVVVVENLEGNEEEPPPLEKPEPPPPPKPEPPPPKPQPKPKEPEKPKELEQIVTNIVTKVEKKKEEPRKEPPKKEEKKPEPPKKTKKELMEERLKAIRESAKDTKRRAKPQPNGRTDRKTLSDAEIQKLLLAGYKPGRSTNLAANETQLCYSLIKQAFEAKWDKPPWTDTLRPMTIRVWFGAGGRIVNFKLEQSSGDAKADQSIRSAATRVGAVRNLTAGFIDQYRSSGVPIRFTVEPQ